MFEISQPLVPCAAAVMMPLPPVINRLSPIEESKIRTNKYYPQLTSILPSKIYKIRLTNEQIKQFDILTLNMCIIYIE